MLIEILCLPDSHVRHESGEAGDGGRSDGGTTGDVHGGQVLPIQPH